jgi:hypothetical protein
MLLQGLRRGQVTSLQRQQATLWTYLALSSTTPGSHLALVKSFSSLLPQIQELDARLCADHEFGQDKVISQLVSDSHTNYTDSAVDTFCRLRGIFQIPV